MPVRDVGGDSRVAYRKPQPAEMAPDLLVSPVLPSDERVWVPQAPTVQSFSILAAALPPSAPSGPSQSLRFQI